MELYGKKTGAAAQKITLTLVELVLLALSAWLLFGSAGDRLADIFGWPMSADTPHRRYVIFAFSAITFLRMVLTMFYLMRRRMLWGEMISVAITFSLYYVGFALLVLPVAAPLGGWDYLAMVIFLVGCYLNTASELQRHFFKARPENKGKLYTSGLFAWSMHINFFGDILWIIAYAMITQNLWSTLIVVLAVSFFAFFNVPKLDAYLATRYGADFTVYANRTKRLVPFIW